MRCCVCGREALPGRGYCARCHDFIRNKREKAKRRVAMMEAYDRDRDGFRDHWSGVLLEEEDRDDPFRLCFDHLVPVRESRLVVSSELFNWMKCELGPDEFPRAIQELAAHRAGRPFDRDCIGFVHWKMRAPSPPGRRTRREKAPRVLSSECIICGGPPKRRSKYCPRCLRFVAWRHQDFRVRARALKEAWSPDEDGFVCRYTGVRVDEDDPESPWFLSFDHGIPGDNSTLQIAAYWVNAMKTALSELEFWKVVGEYNRYLDKGGEFNKKIVKFRYWRKAHRHGR